MTPPLYIFSAGLWRLRREVATMTGHTPRRAWWRAGKEGMVAGWGHKPTAARARAAARSSHLPYVAIEDGFLRSLSPGPAQQPVSMVIDRSGIYYDARQHSDLETLLQSADFTAAETERAAALVALIARHRLSKYNDGLDSHNLKSDDRPLVVVVDQTAGDASVEGGLAGRSNFEAMLTAAVSENPEARIVAKLHPEVIAGTKRGYLRDAATRLGVDILAANINPWTLLDLRPRIYTVSSQLGFEALLAGCPVTCFGVPFYAGWGLTDDRVAVPRRGRRRSLTELAAAVYLRYSRYFDPWTRVPIEAETAVLKLAYLRRSLLANRMPVVCYGIAPWKRPAVTAMLTGPGGPPVYTRNLERARAIAAERGGAIAAWGETARGLRRNPALASVPILAVEDGFVRSVGLGALLVPPLSLVFDSRGIYYDPAHPSDLEHILNTHDFTDEERARAKALRQRIVAARITKYNLADASTPHEVPQDRPRILVPGQVADDAAVRFGPDGENRTGNVNSVLLSSVRRRHPDAYVIFKPHPDVERSGRSGSLPADQERRDADWIARRTNLDSLLASVDRVETYGSLAGFEGLLRELPVTVHGMPFYAGWGLTEDLTSCDRRRRLRSLDELAGAALILYPRYWDPVSCLPCPPETALDRLDEMRAKPPGFASRMRGVMGRAVIFWRRLVAWGVPAERHSGKTGK